MHVTHNLMQDSVRDFFISNVNIGVGSTGPQLLEGRCWGKGGDFFQGGGLQFSHKKKNLKYLMTKKFYKQKYFFLTTNFKRR